jgi:hypothetical protein
MSTAVQQRDGWKAAEIKFGSAGVVPALLLTPAAVAASSSSLSLFLSLSMIFSLKTIYIIKKDESIPKSVYPESGLCV